MSQQSGGYSFHSLVNLLCAKLSSRRKGHNGGGTIAAQPGRRIETDMNIWRQGSEACAVYGVGESGPCPWPMGAHEKVAKAHWETREHTALTKTMASQHVHRMEAWGPEEMAGIPANF